VKRFYRYSSLFPIYCLIIAGFILLAVCGSSAVSVFYSNTPILERKTVIIDAGHGGEDGGATSCTGVLESSLNLEIAIKLNDFLHLLGLNTLMIRDGDYSVYTKGETLGEKKISDLKERVRIINSTKNAILISIHQNYFSDSKYHGAQVFYASTNGSRELANALQDSLRRLDTTNKRQCKMISGIYLLRNISCPGILVECGFLSNISEEALLRNNHYQNMLCAVIGTTCSNFYNSRT